MSGVNYQKQGTVHKRGEAESAGRVERVQVIYERRMVARFKGNVYKIVMRRAGEGGSDKMTGGRD